MGIYLGTEFLGHKVHNLMSDFRRNGSLFSKVTAPIYTPNNDICETILGAFKSIFLGDCDSVSWDMWKV